MHVESDGAFAIDIEQKLPPRQLMLFAFQHLLALTGIWIFPVLIGQALNLSTVEVGTIIQACFLTTGLVTILQSGRMLRLPVVQGPTAVFFVVLVAGAHSYGLGAAFGSMAVAGVIFALLSLPIRGWALLPRLAPFVSAPVVFGTLLVIIGGQLAGIGLPNWFDGDGSGGIGFISALTCAIVVLISIIFGGNTVVRRGALLIGIVVGSILHIFVAGIDLTPIRETPLLQIVQPAPFGLGVAWPLVGLMLLAYVQAGSEAMGMYSLLARWGGQSLSRGRIGRGLFGEFVGCAIGALFGGLGTTSYAENVGIIRVSGVGSRWVTMTAGICAIIVGLIPMFGILIASLPSTVLAAASTILFGIIAISGIQMMRDVVWDELNLMVAAVSFIVSLGCAALPAALFSGKDPIVQGLFTQPILVGIILLMVLQVVVNVLIRPCLERKANSAAQEMGDQTIQGTVE
ncbi:uracil-xanthine permease family protein [Sphingosinicella xenopeptidilytica]|uniref:Uracil-xanthine permease family protein n=1 Tax=Sphingosinicella xenopeptidilytica TaxID=364098 RepID=A0ABW3C5H1_SPHXN